MNTASMTAVEDIPAIEYDEWIQLATAELDQLIDALARLSPDQWRAPTPCADWDVRAMAGHLLGMMRLGADRGELQRQVGEATRRLEAAGGYRIDHLTALQVEEHAGLTTDALLEEMRLVAPRAIAGRAGWTEEERAAPYVPGPPYDGAWTRGYLFGCVHTRDPFLHRTVDLASATGESPTLSAEHDGRIVADVVAEWARRHGQACSLVLTGPAGGTYSSGEGGQHYELDALQFCRLLSGRGTGAGLLAYSIPF
jgi:uncharacterized protein (TIGR03083 family)